VILRIYARRFGMTGQLNGYAKASWVNGGHPKLDARLVTRKGELGLAAEDPQDPPTTLAYDELSVIAKSISDGLLFRVDVKHLILVQDMRMSLLIHTSHLCQCMVRWPLMMYS
jgi:hypothetical protein